MKVLVYDIETLKRLFLFIAYIPETDQWYRFKVYGTVNELDKFIKFAEQYEDYYWVGYNNLSFDSQVIEWIYRNYSGWMENLTGREIAEKISQKANDVIHDSNYGVFPEYREDHLSFKQIDLFRIHHFDNKNRRVSLKRLEFEMDMPNIEEMPIHHMQEELSEAEIDETVNYCNNDVISTTKFYNITIGNTDHNLYKGNDQIQLRLDIEEEFKIKCLNFSDSKIGDEIIKKYYCESTGIEYSKLPKKGFFRKSIDLSTCIASSVS